MFKLLAYFLVTNHKSFVDIYNLTKLNFALILAMFQPHFANVSESKLKQCKINKTLALIMKLKTALSIALSMFIG